MELPLYPAHSFACSQFCDEHLACRPVLVTGFFAGQNPALDLKLVQGLGWRASDFIRGSYKALFNIADVTDKEVQNLFLMEF